MADDSRPTSRGSPLGDPHNQAATADAVREMFGRVAPRYDFLNQLLSLRRDIAWRNATAKELRQVLGQQGSVAVDVCCGTGDLAMALARYSVGTVVGTDFSPPMLRLARDKVRRSGGAVFFLEADSLCLPFADGSLDVISVAFGFRNLASYDAGLREMHRVLKPGGKAAILEFSTVRWPVFGPLFRSYFHHILPWIGTWISRVSGPYQYLPQSVSLFPDQEQLATAMTEVGFVEVRYRNFLGGVAALHLGRKA